jgi:hypothetical protein
MDTHISKSSIGTTCFLSFTSVINIFAILIRTMGYLVFVYKVIFKTYVLVVILSETLWREVSH